jgi:GTP-binding protein
MNTLFHLRNQKNIIGHDGENGQTKMATGKSAKPTYLNLPLGTSVYDVTNKELLVDILTSGQTYIVCHGGKGGHGNAFFKSSFNKAPTIHENGDLGETRTINLKLKYMADVGIIGLPNAGKSTLIGSISNAKSKVANYQFTTLTPVLGKVKIQQDELVFADIPGLIAGAAQGKGLGHEFLKHIERCHVLIHLISLSSVDNPDIVEAYKTIVNELQHYDQTLIKKPIITVANKIDANDNRDNLTKLNHYLKTEVITISAKANLNINILLNSIHQSYTTIKQKLLVYPQTPKSLVIEVKQQKDYIKDLIIKQVDEHT